MGSLGSFLIVYVLGGITFLPIVLALLILHAILTLPPAPRRSDSAPAVHSLSRPADDEYSLKSGTDQLAEQFHRTHVSDVAAGYFAVCREYVPGGVNGKPPERTTPAGEVVAAESPSVYQSMYRSLFDRKQAPSIEPAKSNGKSTKRARNVFYIVLRHGHLMLYDDANQVEVRYVISLAHHDVSIYSGGEEDIPEGELWLKRNAICLSRRLDSLGDLGGPTPPFYLFSENLSEKEDFYHAMLHNQSRMWDSADRPPKYQEFDVKDIVTLVQRLHSSEEQLQTRWINAILGRLFLALYRTPEWEEFIRGKITKKISRVNKPSFVSRIGLQKIDLGEGAPLITNPRLKDLTVDGNCCVEADMQYTGNFRVEIQATVRIDLGQRFKAREVDIVLAVVLKKLEGHLLVRAKPPPSNRFWMAFETMPRMEMDIQPIVSSKQITYGLILRTIESKIREVVAESIVLPFWDDVPFLDTLGQAFRGGVWQRDIPEPDLRPEIPDESESTVPGTPKSVRAEGGAEVLKAKDEKTMSMPVLPDPSVTKLKSRKGPKSPISERFSHSPSASSTGIDRSDSVPLPRAIRTSQTFSLAADPVVTADNAKVDPVVSESKGEEKTNATSSMIEIRNRSPPASPSHTPSSSPPTAGPMMPEYALHSREPSIAESIDSVSFVNDNAIERPSPARLESNSFSSLRSSRGSSSTSVASDKPKRRSTIETITRSITSASSSDDKPMTIGAATAAAKKWGWNVFGKGDQNGPSSEQRHAGTPDQPIGRGHPHPAPGAPLPRPEKYSLKKTQASLPKRKPVPPPLPDRPRTVGEQRRPVPPPPLPRRKPAPPTVRTDGGSADELLVVEAPRDSEPSSPALGELQEDGRLPEEAQEPEPEQSAVSEISTPVESNTVDDETAGSVESEPPVPAEEKAAASVEESDTPTPADLTTTTTTADDDEEEDEDEWEGEAGQEIPSLGAVDQTPSSTEDNGIEEALPPTEHAAPAQSLETEPTPV
ncbi:hypothetical protein N7474_005365 [Penicillium riverlandense]|uniref:uncharacterized protein n=1 Tax=Penicillium riverlandense TaxID=1903569 RepID=UPI00254995DC|nr:uncharacterized protein N7474_005365 [Penicillium riverlandense]KAJ5819774.1 hypothetical protein N7474_005365 [Penicillium riverlandense]